MREQRTLVRRPAQAACFMQETSVRTLGSCGSKICLCVGTTRRITPCCLPLALTGPPVRAWLAVVHRQAKPNTLTISSVHFVAFFGMPHYYRRTICAFGSLLIGASSIPSIIRASEQCPLATRKRRQRARVLQVCSFKHRTSRRNAGLLANCAKWFRLGQPRKLRGDHPGWFRSPDGLLAESWPLASPEFLTYSRTAACQPAGRSKGPRRHPRREFPADHSSSMQHRAKQFRLHPRVSVLRSSPLSPQAAGENWLLLPPVTKRTITRRKHFKMAFRFFAMGLERSRSLGGSGV